MDLGTLSGNWKKLNARLQSTKLAAAEIKTKDPIDQAVHNGVKRRRARQSYSNDSHKRRKMSEMKVSLGSAKPLIAPAAAAKPSDTSLTNCGFAAGAEAGKFIALDCEMVGVGPEPDDDSQLARVSITNYNGDLLYDSYVEPVLEVTDYRTEVSGIRPQHLQRGTARPFKEVQKDVSTLLEGRIVVGHALKNDFTAIIINHPRRDIRDTSKLQKYRALAGGRSPSLKKLAKEILGLQIQGGEHSSIEDARTSMLLFRQERDRFEKEHMQRWGKSTTLKGSGRFAETIDDVSLSSKTPQAVARHKRLSKKRAKKR